MKHIICFSVYEDSLLDLEKDFDEPMRPHSSKLVHSNQWLGKLEDKMKTGELNNLFNSF